MTCNEVNCTQTLKILVCLSVMETRAGFCDQIQFSSIHFSSKYLSTPLQLSCFIGLYVTIVVRSVVFRRYVADSSNYFVKYI